MNTHPPCYRREDGDLVQSWVLFFHVLPVVVDDFNTLLGPGGTGRNTGTRTWIRGTRRHKGIHFACVIEIKDSDTTPNLFYYVHFGPLFLCYLRWLIQMMTIRIWPSDRITRSTSLCLHSTLEPNWWLIRILKPEVKSKYFTLWLPWVEFSPNSISELTYYCNSRLVLQVCKLNELFPINTICTLTWGFRRELLSE